jgi:menaquinone-9 beta-reductase
MQLRYDAVVIGAGPSGATAAILLARAGWSVALVEQKVFPRRKVCGEVISATNFPILTELGVMASLRTYAGPQLREVALYTDQDPIVAPLPRLDGVEVEYSCTCAREHLDLLLLESARAHGVTVWSPWQAKRLEQTASGRFVCWIQVLESKDREAPIQLSATVFICAHGSWDVGGLPTQAYKRNHQAGDLFAFKAHLRGCELRPGLLPVLAFEGGYGGIVRIDADRTTFAFCVRRDVLHQCRLQWPGLPAAEAVQQYVIAKVRGLENIVANAKMDGPWLAVGPLRPGLRPVHTHGALAIGNALCESHPLIGEGMSMAIQSAWLLCEYLKHQQPASLDDQALARIAETFIREWRHRYSWRMRTASVLAHAAMRPTLVKTALPCLRRYPLLLTLAARLAGKAAPVQRIRHGLPM